MLSVKGISKSLGNLDLRDISFEAQRSRYFVLLGASGVGKSVLLEMIAGLNQPDTGQIFLDGKDITNEKIQKRKIAMVFQNSVLFPHMTVYENIAYPLRCKKVKSSQIKRRLTKLADDFVITGLLNRDVKTLSGGEAQRVSLARALASEPRCLLLDEPLSSLDVKSRPAVRSILRKIAATDNLTIVHVTHDYTEAACLGTHIAVMENGRIAQTGTAKEVFQHPKSEFVARFVGIRNFFEGQLQDSHRSQTNAKRFITSGLHLLVLTDSSAADGFVSIRSEDVTISNTRSQTSARNNFEGTVADIIPAAMGVEIVVDIGVEITALVTAESVERLNLHYGKKVWVSFKASAVKYIEQ